MGILNIKLKTNKHSPPKVKKELGNNLIAFLFISPWLLGLLAFYVGPMFYSLYLSLTEYNLISSPKFIGFDNYVRMFTRDDRFMRAIEVTFKFVFLSVPLKLAFALMLAMIFNGKIRGMSAYRTIYYAPSIIGGSVAVAIIWRMMFAKDGAINQVLGYIGIEAKHWITSPDTALSTLIILVVWQFGSPMLIFLAGLKQIPAELYESASIDGANRFRKFTHITIPMLSPIIFFNLIMQLIHAFMAFTQSFLITKGGPADSTLFYAVYLYDRGFAYFQMGYASALAWVLLLIVGFFTILIFRTSNSWVHYENEGGK
jgi:multiple sugar transport system permease protein